MRMGSARKAGRAKVAERRINKGAKPKRSRFLRWAERIDATIETHPVARLLGLVVGFIGLMAACTAFIQITLDISNRQDDRIARAWEVVTRPVPGNTGKGSAISYLMGRDNDMIGLDISCQRMNGGWDAETLSCQSAPTITDLNLDDHKSFILWNVSGVHFIFDDLSDSRFEFADMRGALFTATKLDGSSIVARMDGTQFLLTDLSDVSIAAPSEIERERLNWPDPPEAAEVWISGADMSGFRIYPTWITIESQHNFSWADEPALRGLAPVENVTLCNPSGIRRDAGGDMENLADGIRLSMPEEIPVFPRCQVMTPYQARDAFPKQWKYIKIAGAD